MEELKIFSASYVDRLYRTVKNTENFDNYYQKSFPFEEKFPKGRTNIFLSDDFELDPNKTDLENSISLYSVLRLNETQASDPRLWTYLTHVRFWKYMRERWALEDVRKGDNFISRIIDRYFLINPRLESLTRNGVSRLWWYAPLTKEEGRLDNFELTRVLLSRAEVAVGVLERIIGINRNMRIAILEFLHENNQILSNEYLTRKLFRALNLFGGTKILPLLEIKEIKDILDYIKPAA